VPYKHLTDEELRKVYDAAIEAGQADSRRALLAGLGPAYIGGLQTDARPNNQLKQDLDAINGDMSLDDGTVPFELWLSSAAQLARPRRQAAVFLDALTKVKAIMAGTRAPAVGTWVGIDREPPKPENGPNWDGRLDGAESQSLLRALVSAFPSLEALRALVRFKLDKNLAEIAPNGALDDVVFALIEQALARGWTQRLVVGALEMNPGNPELLAFAGGHGVTPKV
jgi:hypothetical protein